MEFNYAPPPRAKRSPDRLNTGPPLKKSRTDFDFSDLPTHLPNAAPTPLLPAPHQTDAPVAGSEKASETKKPIFIEGTNITLETEDDIAKWIEERRKNWPTRKNVEAKLKKQNETKVEKPDTPKQSVCKFFARTGKCKFGNKCKNLHEPGFSKDPGCKMINGLLVRIPERYKKEVDYSGSLFTKLVQRDLYEHQNNTVIDFVQYLDSKGLIDKNAKA